MPTFAQKQKQPPQKSSANLTRSNALLPAASQEAYSLLHLQRTIGNQGALRSPHARADGLEAGADTEVDSETPATARFAHDFSRIPVHAPAPKTIRPKLNVNAPGDIYEQEADHVVERVMRMPEAKFFDGKETLADWLPQTRGTVAERTMVHSASPVADRVGANAVTLGQAVHLSSGLSRLEASEQLRVLAHEAVHIAQHSAPGAAASRPALEMEAHQLSSQLLAGHEVQPQFHADPMTSLADDGGELPGDRIAVARAKARREVLLRFAEAQDIRAKRQRLDEKVGPARLAELEKRTGVKGKTLEDYRDWEQNSVAQLNRKPVTLEVTPTTVRIRARFQVRFEGIPEKEAKAKFSVLEQSFQKGVSDTWNQKLSGAVMSGRTLEMIPELKLVSKTASRDKNFWLLTVRPTDQSPAAYENTPFPTDNPLMLVTDPNLDGGVMSIPPKGITDPVTLGHETLHLFGMADRYVPLGKDRELPLRETKDDADPLTGGGGRILEEDVGFALDALGAYPSGPEREVRLELKKVEEIIRTRRDPDSLVRKRQDFTDKTIKQAEDLE